MTLADAASFSTALSGFAVTASLIYLGIQTRQAAKHTRALIQQGATARTTAITLGMMPADYCAAWIAANGVEPSLSEIRKRQFGLHCVTAINAMEDLYAQHSGGLLSAEWYERQCDTFRGLLSEPGLRAYWTTYRDTGRSAPNFRAFVDSLITDETTVFAHRL